MENIVKDKNNEFVKLVNVNKIYNKKVHAVYDFNLDIKKKEFIVFVGPSGCGKSTTLRMIAGLEEISSGELYIDGVLSNDALPKERDVAMVFQSYALYPNMTVFENMAFALEVQHLPKEEIQNRVNKAAKILQLEDYLHRKPKALSGGQRQRVALGRAIVRNARLFLMDEPLSNLDAKLRVQMRTEITKIHKQIDTTTIYVTHDQTEAMTMADRIVVMKDGYVQQIGTPYEIYMNPTNQFVASFIGSPAMNMIEATYDNGVLRFDNGYEFKLSKKQIELHTEFYKKRIKELESDLEDAQKIIEDNAPTLKKRLSLFKKKSKDKKQNKSKDEIINEIQNEINKVTEINSGASHKLIFGVRPESIKRVSESIKESQKYKVKICELLGDEYYVHFEFGGNDFLAKVPSETKVSVDDDINFVIDNDKTYLFDTYSGKTIK